MGGGRVLRPPKTTSEALELRASDGVSLACTVHTPEKRSIGDVVLVHGAFSRQSSFTWPGGLADFFREAGHRVMTFDFRGHGKSGTPARDGGGWTYDDLVRRDLPAVVDALRARRARGPLWIVGHSLGGHVALAAQGVGLVRADGIVTMGTTLWRRSNASAIGWVGKRALLRFFSEAAERRGYFPARFFRVGSDDEALGYVRDMDRIARGEWKSADGQDDYDAGMRSITAPVYAIASDGDRLQSSPAAVRSFHASCKDLVVDVISRADDGGPPPNHAELVTTRKARSAYERAVVFLRDRR